MGLDIWRRDQGVLPLTGPSIGAARSELIAGVLGQVAERFAIEVQAVTARAPVAVTDVGTVFEAAASQGSTPSSSTARSRTRCRMDRWRRA